MEISVYGKEGCPQRALTAQFIADGGARATPKDIEQEPPSLEVLDRLVSFESALQDDDSNVESSADRLRKLLLDSSLPAPLAVRGSRVVIASDPSRVQSLMY